MRRHDLPRSQQLKKQFHDKIIRIDILNDFIYYFDVTIGEHFNNRSLPFHFLKATFCEHEEVPKHCSESSHS